MSARRGRRIRRWAPCGLIAALVTWVISGCQVTRMASPAPDGVAVASPAVPGPPLPAVPGLSDDEVASLASLVQVDEYPLYVMHLYGSRRARSPSPTVERDGQLAWACSLFAAMGEPEHPLYGRDFDWSYSPALLLFNHPDEGYDSISMVDLAYLVDEDHVRGLVDAPLGDRLALLEAGDWPFDGMNEMGLSVGMAAVADVPLLRDPTLPTIGSLGIIREWLDHAASVDEAVALVHTYNVDMRGGPTVHYLIADATGYAALVELFEGEIVVIPNEFSWHLATNHYRAPLREGETGGCWRYAKLDEVLTAASGKLTAVEALALLSDVAQSSTQWSVVYDMGAREIHVVMGQDYVRVHTFDLRVD